MKVLDIIAIVLLLIGGLNWGLVGAADFDLVAALFGPGSPISRVIYILVALSALYYLFQWKNIHRRCCDRHHNGGNGRTTSYTNNP